ncbi:hypothetical protein DFJ58DRAFT_422860 [Suillus subalutaceus]|uniref:uncharacterized protein n=1 Tax=Suillus subalutaceus TaxID=48586 RepID=UPI001B86AAEE|nr:uncharacterized protein DFJ58DRAFT_422860 [Suillus subalutaceus]KAG1821268.1 hypothetical protein DFJ58DRAFT_422860 [Suillus subalutaceus]
MVYDWALTFEQEFELILRKRWSFMTVLYICVRYIGILFAVILFIMIARINAMYRGSKKLLLSCCSLASLHDHLRSLMVIGTRGISTQETTLSAGYHICIIEFDTSMINLDYESLVSTAAWEILNLFLAVWIVIQHPGTATIADRIDHRGLFQDIIESHTFYFLAFAAVACFELGALSPNITNSLSVGSAIYSGIWSIADALQMFVLGSRLILSVRGYHAKVVARANGGTE